MLFHITSNSPIKNLLLFYFVKLDLFSYMLKQVKWPVSDYILF